MSCDEAAQLAMVPIGDIATTDDDRLQPVEATAPESFSERPVMADSYESRFANWLSQSLTVVTT
jgi:hypothetical protein